MQRSPKGLIVNRSVTPDEMAQLDISPDVRQESKKLFAYFRSVAESYIETNPVTDGTLDCTAAAKAMLHSVAAAERNAAIGDLLRAVYYTQLSSIYHYQLGIIDNETAIVAWLDSIKGARRGGILRSADNRIRNRKWAREYLNRRGGRLSNTALMEAIGAKEKLGRSGSINAIKSGLRDLKRWRGLRDLKRWHARPR
jgi:hypothetical protein